MAKKTRKKTSRRKTAVDRAAAELREVMREEKKLDAIRKRVEAKRKKAEAAANREADKIIAQLDATIGKIRGSKRKYSKKRKSSKKAASKKTAKRSKRK